MITSLIGMRAIIRTSLRIRLRFLTTNIVSYSQSSFTLTKSAGATATFTFNGTGVQIFGAKRGNHGAFTVNLDGAITNENGQSSDPGIFQTALFSTSNLPQGLHTVVLSNPGTNFLDIDFVRVFVYLLRQPERLRSS